MLSDALAVPLAYIALFGMLFMIFFIINYHENLRYSYRGSWIPTFLQWTMTFALLASLIYSLVSLYVNEDYKTHTTFKTSVEQKYGISMTDEQLDALNNLVKEYDEEGQPIYSSGSTTINGRDMILLWHGEEFYIMEYVDGKMTELKH